MQARLVASHTALCRIAVTGANSGTGLALALWLAKQRINVLLLCRNRERGLAAQRSINSQAGGEYATFVELDLADLDSVQRCAAFLKTFLSADRVLHGLVCNAGLMVSTTQGLLTTKENIEARKWAV